MIGAPGSGKINDEQNDFPLSCLRYLWAESLETTKIHSVCRKIRKRYFTNCQTTFPKPSPILFLRLQWSGWRSRTPSLEKLALLIMGLLYLDELAEFNRSVAPKFFANRLKTELISVSRAKYSIDYPAGFMMIASMNPFRVVYYNHPNQSLCMQQWTSTKVPE